MSSFQAINCYGQPVTPTMAANGTFGAAASAEAPIHGPRGQQSLMMPPSEPLQWHNSSIPRSASTSAVERIDRTYPAAGVDHGIRRHVDEALRPVLERLTSIEQRHRDPSGDVTDALRDMHEDRKSLMADLSQKYEEHFNYMQEAAQKFGTWQAQLSSLADKHYNNRSAQLSRSAEEMFKRLSALEQSVSKAAEQNAGNCEQRMKAIEESLKLLDTCTEDLLKRADSECASRYRDHASAGERFGGRLAKLEESIRDISQWRQKSEDCQDPSVLGECTRRLDEQQKTLESLVIGREDRDKTEIAWRQEIQRSIKTVEDRVKKLDCDTQNSLSGEQAGETTQALTGPIIRAGSDGDKIASLATEIQSQAKFVDQRVSFLVDLLHGINEQDTRKLQNRLTSVIPKAVPQPAPPPPGGLSAVESTFVKFFGQLEQRLVTRIPRTPAQQHDDDSLSERVQALEHKINQTTAASAHQGQVEKQTCCGNHQITSPGQDFARDQLVVTIEKLSTRIQALESSAVNIDVPVALNDVRMRLSNLEKASLAAAIDQSFTTLSDRTMALKDGVAAADNDLRALMSRVSKIEAASMSLTGDGSSGAPAACESQHQAMQRRLDIVEKYAETSAAYHNVRQTDCMDLRKSIEVLEQRERQQIDRAEAMKQFEERVSRVEEFISGPGLQKKVDDLACRQIATLADLTERIGSMERDMQKMTTATQDDLNKARDRLSTLEQHKSACLDLEERGRADREKLAEKNSMAQKQLQDLETGHRNTLSATETLWKEVEKLVRELESRGMELLQVKRETDGLTIVHAEHEKQLIGLRDDAGDTRSRIDRVSAKSERDDLEVVNELRLMQVHQKHNQNSIEDQIARLRDDLRDVKTASEAEALPQRREGVARDPCHCDENSGWDHDAHRQLSELFRLMLDSVHSKRKAFDESGIENRTTSERREQTTSFTTPVERTTPMVLSTINSPLDPLDIAVPSLGPASSSPRAAALEEQVPTATTLAQSSAAGPATPSRGGWQREAPDEVIPDPIVQPSAKLRRLNYEADAGSAKPSRSSQVCQAITADEKESDMEQESMPRRSDRKGKGRNEWLESMPGMLTGVAWKNSMLKNSRRQKRARE